MSNPLKYADAIVLEYNTFYNEKYIPHRRQKILLLSDILGKYERFTQLDYSKKVQIVKEIEEGCFEEAYNKMLELDQDFDWDNPMFYNVYNYICGNLFQNLDPNSAINSEFLLNKIFNNEYELRKLGGMTSEQLCPEKSIEIRASIAQRSDIKYSTKSSSMYRCSKCKKNECILERRHTRGLDEATNYRATCIFCKHTWNI